MQIEKTCMRLSGWACATMGCCRCMSVGASVSVSSLLVLLSCYHVRLLPVGRVRAHVDFRRREAQCRSSGSGRGAERREDRAVRRRSKGGREVMISGRRRRHRWGRVVVVRVRWIACARLSGLRRYGRAYTAHAVAWMRARCHAHTRRRQSTVRRGTRRRRADGMRRTVEGRTVVGRTEIVVERLHGDLRHLNLLIVLAEKEAKQRAQPVST